MSDHLTVKTLLRDAVATLNSLSDSARLDAEVLLAEAMASTREFLYAWPDSDVSAAQSDGFQALVERRESGEPIAYLTGRREFWSLDLAVTPDTLIPRPETERVVEIALECVAQEGGMYIADIGTGSGAIAIALAVERPLAHVIATDVSEACVDVARTNAARLDVINLEIRCGDLFEPLAGERFDLLVSNPPYVAAGDPHLALGDVRFEPRLALEAGGDGMEVINRLTDLASHHLIGGGAMIVEHGFEQGALVRDAMARGGLVSPTTFRDYAGLERVTTARNL